MCWGATVLPRVLGFLSVWDHLERQSVHWLRVPYYTLFCHELLKTLISTRADVSSPFVPSAKGPCFQAGVVSLQKLLVREKAGQESRGIYLISSNPADPEMFELKVHKPKDKHVWIRAVRTAVQGCQEDEEDSAALTSEDIQRRLNAKQHQIRQIVGEWVQLGSGGFSRLNR
ncbi:unnamed protein product, partial [Timema podura]|nr:unnamed protein product [Timema podura]